MSSPPAEPAAAGAAAGRFPIRFDPAYGRLSSLLLLRPADAFVEVREDEVEVRMAWAFRARFPRAAVRAATEYDRTPLSRGVHGLAGRWLVNGSGRGIVRLALAPTQRAAVMGFPVRLRELLVSVQDPAALLRALGR